MSESNNNIPMRITQLEEATAYEKGMYYAVAKAGSGTKKIDVGEPTLSELKIENFITDTNYTGLSHVLEWVNGSWTGVTLTNNNTRVRPKDFIFVKKGDIININNGVNYEHAVSIWSGDLSNYVQLRNDGTFNNQPETITINYDGFIIVTFADVSNHSKVLNPNDFDGDITYNSYLKRIIDETNKTAFFSKGAITNSSVNIDELENNSIYSLNFPANTTNIPSGLPWERYPTTLINNAGMILTTYKTTYGIQVLIVDDIYIRINAGGWGAWRKLGKNEVIVSKDNANAKYTNILEALLTEPRNTTFRIVGSFNLFNEYKEHFGDDFWDNYEGYANVPNGIALGYGGLPLKSGQCLVGDTDAEISMTVNELNTYMSQQFSLIFSSSDNSIKNIKLKCTDASIRYHIHDDNPTIYRGSKNIIENNVFIGTPAQFGCIGGGLGRKQEYIIKNNIFLNETSKPSIFYHNNSNSDAENKITIQDNYCNSNIVLYKYGSSTLKTYAFVTGNKATAITCADYPGATVGDNIEMYSWNNDTNS